MVVVLMKYVDFVTSIKRNFYYKMIRRINFIGILSISILCILLIFASHRLSSTNFDYYKSGDIRQNIRPSAFKNNNKYVEHNNKYFDLLNNVIRGTGGGGGDSGIGHGDVNNIDTNNKIKSSFGSGSGGGGGGSVTPNNTSITLNDILSTQRLRIVEEMENFEYPRDVAEKLSDLIIENKGMPIRSVILATWRSGSTFLGDLLNSMPGNYYHYEPLINYEIIQIRGPPYDKPAIESIKKLLLCNYTNMNDYLDYGRTINNALFIHNTRLWKQCRLYPQFCWEPIFLEPFCKLFPLQSMKIVRIRVALADQLLNDSNLNVRIIVLIRDPRGTLQSRRHRDWCPGQPDCDHAPTVCRDMVSDYYASEILLKKYPSTFKVMRYEDLSLNPYDQTQEILDFYGLPFDPKIEEFLDSHTMLNIGGVSSTFRDSKSAPFHWIQDLNFSDIDYIQQSCTKAMELWGYRKADQDTILNKTFNPLLSAPFS